MTKISDCPVIAERGSLILRHEEGDDREPEQYWVQFRDQPSVVGSLAVARDWFEVGGVRLNGSQAQTIVLWAGEYL